jgi:hypothetical protein
VILGGEAGVTTEPVPVEAALDGLSTSLDHLVKLVEDGGLDSLDNSGLLGFVQSFEKVRNRLPLVDHRVIADAESRQLPEALTQPTMARVLASLLRLSPGEAHRRVKAAAAVGQRRSMLGEALEPTRPVLAAAQRAGDVTPEQVHLIQRALASVDRPAFSPDGKPSRSVFDADERSHPQRMHDALEEVCDRILRSDGLPDSGGTPATVIVTITLEDLLDRLGFGTTSDGTPIPTDQLLKMANQADILPTVLSMTGNVLDQGRSRRVVTAKQTMALIARDRGCSFPGCTHPPEWCERHHIKEWINGGKTDLRNLTLLCRYHHHNFVSKRLDLPAESRRTAGMATTEMARPRAKTDPQHTNTTRPPGGTKR